MIRDKKNMVQPSKPLRINGPEKLKGFQQLKDNFNLRVKEIICTIQKKLILFNVENVVTLGIMRMNISLRKNKWLNFSLNDEDSYEEQESNDKKDRHASLIAPLEEKKTGFKSIY